ncbi:hypothetical protein [Winslowiella toletana]|uniref:hypothetical protein n=1 Tax=Winslowiella toletana TaxID=92490 RepID=UPI0028BF452E|nr:hypothetical protein [Winslowiella toletana]WNN45618.1 hypothetical protein RIN69_06985 [Winslowiella toletana]
MSDYFAARQNDALVHTSMFAEITSLLVEGAAYAAAGAAVAAAAAVTAPLAGAGALAAGLAAVGSGCVLSGIIGGLLANLAGVTCDISRAADGISSFLFPPRPLRAHHQRLSRRLYQRPARRACRRQTASVRQPAGGCAAAAGLF